MTLDVVMCKWRVNPKRCKVLTRRLRLLLGTCARCLCNLVVNLGVKGGPNKWFLPSNLLSSSGKWATRLVTYGSVVYKANKCCSVLGPLASNIRHVECCVIVLISGSICLSIRLGPVRLIVRVSKCGTKVLSCLWLRCRTVCNRGSLCNLVRAPRVPVVLMKLFLLNRW